MTGNDRLCHCRSLEHDFGGGVTCLPTCVLCFAGGGAYVTTPIGGMYAPSRKGRRHAKLRHVCATREFYSAMAKPTQ